MNNRKPCKSVTVTDIEEGVMTVRMHFSNLMENETYHLAFRVGELDDIIPKLIKIKDDYKIIEQEVEEELKKEEL